MKSVEVDCWLLTGGTGLVGRFVLAELLRAGKYVVTLVRDRAAADARLRIEEALAPFESEAALIRPRVVSYDLTQPGLAITDRERRWLKGKRLGVIHSAASIRFQGSGPDSEPYLSNVGGTRNLLDFLREMDVSCFHYVSTAYVTSRSVDHVDAALPRYERRVQPDAMGGNDYESSKIRSEQMILDCEWLKSKTILRPSIIVGDSQSHYSSTFHGFYAALQIASQVVKFAGGDPLIGTALRTQLGLHEHDTKNFVPVDWVARAIVRIALDKELHGRIYHLTNPRPVSCADVQVAIEQSLAPRLASGSLHGSAASTDVAGSSPQILRDLASIPANFREQLAVYETYFNCDPIFDCSNTLHALADLPCPRVDVNLLVKLAQFALKSNFGWPRPTVTLPEHTTAFDGIGGEAAVDRSSSGDVIALRVLGPGAPPPICFEKMQGKWTATDCPPAGDQNRLTLVGNSVDIAKCFQGSKSLSELASSGWLACTGTGAEDLGKILLELERDLKSHS